MTQVTPVGEVLSLLGLCVGPDGHGFCCVALHCQVMTETCAGEMMAEHLVWEHLLSRVDVFGF